MIQFLFDLDGTVTDQETLPLIARNFGIAEEIEQLTRQTILGNVPFIESFIKRINILGKQPVSEIRALLANVSLYRQVSQFIKENFGCCAIVTGNLGCWVEDLVQSIGCRCYNSSGIVQNDRVVKLETILKKESIVSLYQAQGHKVVFIGEGNNDMEAMRLADISIAAGLTHWPAPSILSIADYSVFSEDALCRLLRQLS